MATNNKVVYLHAEAERRKSAERERERALRVAGMRHKALTAKDTAVRHIALSLMETASSIKGGAVTLARAGLRASYRLLRLGCTLGAAVCLFFMVRDMLNEFPNGLGGFAGLAVIAVGLQCLKLTATRLLAQVREGSVFDFQRHDQ